jgi:hypothetical protein
MEGPNVVLHILRSRGSFSSSLEAWFVFKSEILEKVSVRHAPKEVAVLCACVRFVHSDEAAVMRKYIEYYWDITLGPDLSVGVDDDVIRGGLRLISKENKVHIVEDLNVMGFLFSVTDEEFALLEEAKYPSLFNGGSNKRGILYGPLSLMNHSCLGDWVFSNPTVRNNKNVLEGGLFIWRYVISRQPEVERICGDELLVNYFPEGEVPTWFNCICSKCVV